MGPADRSSKILPKVPVSTSVPAMNATPSVTARAVATSGDGRHQVVGLEHEPHVITPQDGELVIVEGAEVGFADEGLP